MYRGPQRHDFVGIQFDVRLAIEKLCHRAADQRRAGGAAHEHDFVHVRTLELGVRQRLFEGPHGAVNDGANEGVERTACEFMNEYLAVRQYQTKCGRLGFRKLMLHVDQLLAKLLREFAVRRKVDCIMLKNQFVDMSLEQIVNVIAAQMGIAVGREDLIDVAVAGGNEFEDRNIERAAAKVVDGDFAALLFMQAVGECGGGWLVDETQNFEASDLAGIFGGLALGIIEIRGDGDDSAVDRFAEIGLRPVFQFAQDESGNLRRCKHFLA